MSADHHDFIAQRAMAAGDFADDVVRGRGAVPAAVERDADADRLAQRDQARQLFGIRHRQRRRGNRRQAIVEAGDAGMRVAVAVGTGRAHHEGRCAGADRRRGAAAAHAAARAVAAAVARALHPVVDEGDLAGERAGRRGFQRGEIGETHDLGFDRACGAAAKGGQRERLRVIAHDGGRFAAAHPLRKAHRLQPDLVVAQRLELRLGPAHGARIGFAAGQARTDFGGQRFEHLPRGAITQCSVAQRARVRECGIGNARLRRCGGECEGRHRQRDGGDQRQTRTHERFPARK